MYPYPHLKIINHTLLLVDYKKEHNVSVWSRKMLEQFKPVIVHVKIIVLGFAKYIGLPGSPQKWWENDG